MAMAMAMAMATAGPFSDRQTVNKKSSGLGMPVFVGTPVTPSEQSAFGRGDCTNGLRYGVFNDLSGE